MSNQYRNLWVFGDSYSTPDICVSPQESFWMAVGKTLKVEKIYNYSWPRNSLDSIAHMLVSDSDQYDWKRDFFLIGVPPLARLTVVSKDDTKSFYRRVFDTNATEIESQLILCHHGLENKSFYHDPTAIRFEDPTWTEIQACKTIFLLNAWLDGHKAKYFIVNLSKGFQNDSPATGKFLLEKCFNHSKNILIGDTYWGINYGINKPVDYDQFGWHGHHGPAGNQYFFENSIFPKMKQQNFI